MAIIRNAIILTTLTAFSVMLTLACNPDTKAIMVKYVFTQFSRIFFLETPLP